MILSQNSKTSDKQIYALIYIYQNLFAFLWILFYYLIQPLHYQKNLTSLFTYEYLKTVICNCSTKDGRIPLWLKNIQWNATFDLYLYEPVVARLSVFYAYHIAKSVVKSSQYVKHRLWYFAVLLLLCN